MRHMLPALVVANLLCLCPNPGSAQTVTSSRVVHPAPVQNFNRRWPAVGGWYERANLSLSLLNPGVECFADYVSPDESWAVRIESWGIEVVDDNLPDMGSAPAVHVKVGGTTIADIDYTHVFGKTINVNLPDPGGWTGGLSGWSDNLESDLSSFAKSDQSLSLIFPRITYTVPLKGFLEIEQKYQEQCLSYALAVHNESGRSAAKEAEDRMHAGLTGEKLPDYEDLEDIGPILFDAVRDLPAKPAETRAAGKQTEALDDELVTLRKLQLGSESQGKPETAVKFSAAERDAIAAHMRPCWTSDPGASDLDKMQALLMLTTDGAGVVRQAGVALADQAKLADPRFRAFAERAVRAVMDPACADLPLPATMLGKINVLTILFKP